MLLLLPLHRISELLRRRNFIVQKGEQISARGERMLPVLLLGLEMLHALLPL